MAQGAPIHLVHAASADDGTMLEVSESVWPPDRIAILDEYPITIEAEEDREASDV